MFMPCANNQGADQPAHPRSLISAFVVRCLDSIITLLAIAEIFQDASYMKSLWLRRPVSVLTGRKTRRQVVSWRGSNRTSLDSKSNDRTCLRMYSFSILNHSQFNRLQRRGLFVRVPVLRPSQQYAPEAVGLLYSYVLIVTCLPKQATVSFVADVQFDMQGLTVRCPLLSICMVTISIVYSLHSRTQGRTLGQS